MFTGKLIKEINGHFDEVSSMVAIGTTLFTASLDGTVRRWSLKEQDLIAPIPKDISESLSSSAQQNSAAEPASVASQAGTVPSIQMSTDEEPKTSLMTEEEERELAELMGSDDDD
ncbi:hypothetical protein EDD21DRAFT_442629 [Dissophora ornata]|nr:hypothetical protein EDD21DRAFT_442629 [Dissophora ornata]